MLTRLAIRNFKQFDNVEIPLEDPVVLIGPNNSGKTTALQALALWELGLRRWREKHGGKEAPGERPGVTVNRRDLAAIPAPSANLLWRNLHVRDTKRVNGAQKTQNIRIEIEVAGRSGGTEWCCGLEFDFANSESFYVRPLRDRSGQRMPIPEEAASIQVAFLPPMSGLAANETKIEVGAINARLGEGRTAEVLRNVCFQVRDSQPEEWQAIVGAVKDLFGVSVEEPTYIAERGEIAMSYQDRARNLFDLSSSGRGLQQTLLLLSFLALNRQSILLLDEPDAHLEILRQREVFGRLREAARRNGGQLIIASHSEVVMNEAASANPNSVVALLGRPHVIRSLASVHRSLADISFEQYYLAEQTGWVLYLEGTTDLDILRAFATRLGHPVRKHLASPFSRYIGNQPNLAREHFNALSEAKPDMVGMLIVDQDAPGLRERPELKEHKWERREIENYLCHPATLENYARSLGEGGPLFQEPDSDRKAEEMRQTLEDQVAPANLRNLENPWWNSMKASDDLLDKVLPAFAQKVAVKPLRKSDYAELVAHIPEETLSGEIRVVLDQIFEVAERARPAGTGA